MSQNRKRIVLQKKSDSEAAPLFAGRDVYLRTRKIDGSGRYNLRGGGVAHIIDKEGEYWYGHKVQNNKPRQTWRWFSDGRSYGQYIDDDIV